MWQYLITFPAVQVVQGLAFIINTVKISLSGSLSLNNIEENNKCKGKVLPRASHEGPEGE